MSAATTLATTNGHQIPALTEAKSVSVPIVVETMDVLKAIRTFIASEFVDGIDFGSIPGTGKIKVRGPDGRDYDRERKVLLLPGAQKACMYFNCYADTATKTIDLGSGHVEYLVKATLISRTTGMKVGMGRGSCSTMEGKYRFRNGNRTCPKCGKETIFASKKDGEGYYCWKQKDGCGAQFKKGDPLIEKQAAGKQENDNPYDLRNTVLKMAVKRATVAAALGLGCLTEMFTQDLEDTYDLRAIPVETTTSESAPPIEPPHVAQNNTGHGRGSYAKPEDEAAYKKRVEKFISQVNSKFLDSWTLASSALVDGIKEPVDHYNINGHMFKWSLEIGVGGLDPMLSTASVSVVQKERYNAIAWLNDKKAFEFELGQYARKCGQNEATRWRKKHVDVSPDDPDFDCAGFRALIEAENEALGEDIIDVEPEDIAATEGGRDG